MRVTARRTVAISAALLLAAGCGSTDNQGAEPAKDVAPVDALTAVANNAFTQTNLAANFDDAKAQFTFKNFVNGWGIADRPAGKGGHFWVGAGDTSFQFVGDVRNSPDEHLRTLHQDALTEVKIPGADDKTTDDSIGKVTGVVFNPSPQESENFIVRDQPVKVDGVEQKLTGSARFIFATDSGVISAWNEGATEPYVRRNGPASEVFNGEKDGMAFFGLAVKPTGDTLWAADFGENPQIRQFDKDFKLVPTQGFANPFATGADVDPANPAAGKQAKPGDPVPFNISTVGDRVFVTYAVSKKAEDSDGFDVGEEDSLDADQEAEAKGKPDKGKVVEFTTDGALVKQINDGGLLNAPWGVAIAPENWGALAGKLLVANFAGSGTIVAYDLETGNVVDYVRDADGKPVRIEGVWGLMFGNGASLGDTDALYFTAGPDEEKQGLFGSLRLK